MSENDLSGEAKREWNVITSAPILFGVALLVVIALVWGFMHWTYRSILAGKDTHIASLDRRLADYRDALGGASPDEARRRIEALQSEVQSLRVRLEPRQLTPAQRQSLMDRSRRPAGVDTRTITVVAERKCSDCASFAEDIAKALQFGDNWKVSVETVDELPQRPRLGLAIRVPEPTRPPPDAVVLQGALRAAYMPFTMLPGEPGTGVELLVAERAPQ